MPKLSNYPSPNIFRVEKLSQASVVAPQLDFSITTKLTFVQPPSLLIAFWTPPSPSPSHNPFAQPSNQLLQTRFSNVTTHKSSKTAMRVYFSGLLMLLLAAGGSAQWCSRFTQQAGGSFCINAFTLPNSTAELQIQCPRSATRGWCGIGIGKDMPNSDMWMFWFDSNNSVVVSDRFGDGIRTPRADTQQDVQLIESRLAANGSWFLRVRRKLVTGDSFDKPIVNTGSMEWFWALSASNRPTTSDPTYFGGQLRQHDFAESIGSVDLFRGKTLSEAPAIPILPNDTALPVDDALDGPVDPNRWMMVTHGVLMFVAWGLLAPFGVAIAVSCRRTNKFPLHVRVVIAPED